MTSRWMLRSWRGTLGAVAVAILAEAASWRDLEPDPLAATVYVICVIGLVALGACAGWRAWVVFLAVFLLAAGVEHAWVYDAPAAECDPFCSSPAAGLVLVLPVCLAWVALGLAGRRVAARVGRRSA